MIADVRVRAGGDDAWLAQPRPRRDCAAIAPINDLRGACRLVAREAPSRRRALSDSWRELADRLVPYVHGPRLHAHRADADHRASARRLVGLPDHRLLRADVAPRHAGRLPRASSTRCHQAGHRRDPRLGARRTSRATPTALAHFDGTALYEHADPRRGRASRLGHARSSTTAATRCAASCSPARCYWLDRVPPRRPARRRRRLDALPRLLAQGRASGCRTATAAARTSRRSTSCASSTPCRARAASPAR